MREALQSQDMGKVIFAFRNHPYHGRVISQVALSKQTGVSQPTLSRMEMPNRSIQDLNKLQFWANKLHIPPQLLWFSRESHSPELPEVNGHQSEAEVSKTQRREFFATAGSAVIGAMLPALDREPDLIEMTLDRGTVSSGKVIRLENIADDLGIRVVRQPPLTVLEPAQRALVTIRMLLEARQPTAIQVRLVRTLAKLNTVVGEILFNENRFERAKHWYRTAEYAANDAGDQYLADIALAGQSYLPTYSQDPRGVISLVSPRLDSNAASSPAVAWLWGMRARAHAALGESNEFDRSIERARECLASASDELVIPGIFSFVPEKLAFYEASGAVLLRRPERALEASETALSLYDMTETTEPALTKLERASALAQSGEVSEACRVAIDAISDPRTYQSITVRTRAHRFDELLGDVRSQEVNEFREIRHELQDTRQTT
jgi:tetratricopeptide (TPR) repeat protein